MGTPADKKHNIDANIAYKIFQLKKLKEYCLRQQKPLE